MWNNIRYTLPLHFVLLFTQWLPDNIIFLRLRGWLAHFFLGRCGRNLRLGRSVVFYNPSKIFIGNNVYIAYGNWFSAGESIFIEDEVVLGPKSIYASSNHTAFNGSFRYGKHECKPILLKKGCWICGNCTITAGSVVAEGTCIGANSVVVKKTKPNSLYAGVPIKYIKNI